MSGAQVSVGHRRYRLGLSASVAALGEKTLSATLARIELSYLGAEENGATGAEIASTIISAFTQLGLEKSVGKSLDPLMGTIEDAASGRLPAGSLGDAAKDGERQLNKLLGRYG